jgi:two-component system, NarL family, nitrate/nitrite response regulator NarL
MISELASSSDDRVAGAEVSILLLEDQGLVRAGMRALIQLCEPRAAIQEAASYDEALRLLAGSPIDIAFLDIDLKETHTGIDVLKYIRASELMTRAIILSARSEESIVLECIRLGACGYILKDTDSDGVFRSALDTVFQGGVFLPAGTLGRGGFSSPRAMTSAAPSLAEIGVKGRASEALYYICQGFSNAVIAHKMGVAESTLANEYNSKLFKLFRVSNRAGLIVEVARRGIIPAPPARMNS